MTHDPKNTKNVKTNVTFFKEKFWENILTFLKKIQLQHLDFGQKMADFTRFWKICKNFKFGSVASVKYGSFFPPWPNM